jgi:hypothetical protein
LVENQDKIPSSEGLLKLLNRISHVFILADDSDLFQELLKSDIVTRTLDGYINNQLTGDRFSRKNWFIIDSFRYAIRGRSTRVLEVYMKNEALFKVVKDRREFYSLLELSMLASDQNTFSYLLNTPMFDPFITGDLVYKTLKDTVETQNTEFFKLLLERNQALSRMSQKDWDYLLEMTIYKGSIEEEYKQFTKMLLGKEYISHNRLFLKTRQDIERFKKIARFYKNKDVEDLLDYLFKNKEIENSPDLDFKKRKITNNEEEEESSPNRDSKKTKT